MQYVKLQLGCLLVILYLVVNYLKETVGEKDLPRNPLFDTLLVTGPVAVLFDGITAWTVNHLDVVPNWLNVICHLLFFLAMDVTIIITTVYLYDEIVGISKRNKKRNLLLLTPGIISVVLILAGMGQLEYLTGEISNYSMGFSVYVCFASLILHYGAIIYLVIARHRFIPKDKAIGIITVVTIVGAILFVQIAFPEVLLTSLCPTIILMGFYAVFENPAIRRITIQNDKMIDGFATMVESRDDNTGGHIRRTRAYVNLMLHQMRQYRRYRDIVTRDYLMNVSNAAPLHDIGKIATPDSILQKPGKLTDEEFAKMKEHSAEGGEIILHTFGDLNNPVFTQIAYDMARYHHEKYNGRGYPDGLSGEEIPLHARIMAIADVFDAVSQKRCYRDAMPLEECFAIIENGAGTDFDPDLVKIFLDAKEDVMRLMNR